MGKAIPSYDDELQMRAFWSKWNEQVFEGAGIARSDVMQAIARTEVEDFLFEEADLLDEWRLPEWLELFTDDASYYVPATDLPSMPRRTTTCSTSPMTASGSASGSSG